MIRDVCECVCASVDEVTSKIESIVWYDVVFSIHNHTQYMRFE